jgi:hypothetical protein
MEKKVRQFGSEVFQSGAGVEVARWVAAAPPALFFIIGQCSALAGYTNRPLCHRVNCFYNVLLF